METHAAEPRLEGDEVEPRLTILDAVKVVTAVGGDVAGAERVVVLAERWHTTASSAELDSRLITRNRRFSSGSTHLSRPGALRTPPRSRTNRL